MHAYQGPPIHHGISNCLEAHQRGGGGGNTQSAALDRYPHYSGTSALHFSSKSKRSSNHIKVSADYRQPRYRD